MKPQLTLARIVVGAGLLALAVGTTACGSSSGATTGGSGSGASGANSGKTGGKTTGKTGKKGSNFKDSDFTEKVVEKVEAPRYLEGIEVEAQNIFREGVRAVVREGNIKKAAGKFREATKLDPKFMEAYFNLGMALERLNKRDEALAVYNEALAKNPNEPSATAYVAKLYLGKGRTAKIKGNEADSKKWIDKAYGLLEPLVKTAPRNVALNNAMALYHLQQNDLKTARSYVKEVLFVEPRNVTGLNTRGLIFLKLKKYRIAEWIFLRKVLTEDPNSTEALTNLGYTYIQMNRRPAAMKFFSKALKIDPNNMDVRMNIAAMLLEHLNYEKANEHYTIVHKAEPTNLEAFEGKCDSAYGMSGTADDSNKQYETAIQCYLAFAEKKTERTDLYKRIATTYQNKLADEVKAIKYFGVYLKKAKLDAKEKDTIEKTIKVLEQIKAQGGLKAMQEKAKAASEDPGDGEGDGGDAGDGDAKKAPEGGDAAKKAPEGGDAKPAAKPAEGDAKKDAAKPAEGAK